MPKWVAARRSLSDSELCPWSNKRCGDAVFMPQRESSTTPYDDGPTAHLISSTHQEKRSDKVLPFILRCRRLVRLLDRLGQRLGLQHLYAGTHGHDGLLQLDVGHHMQGDRHPVAVLLLNLLRLMEGKRL